MRLQGRKLVAWMLTICICLTVFRDGGTSIVSVQAAEKVTRDVEKVDRDLEITYLVDCQYAGGYTGRIRIQNMGVEPVFNWALEFQYDGNLTSIWNGEMVSHTNAWYIVKNAMYNSTIGAGESVEFGFQGSGEFPKEQPKAFQLAGAYKEVAISDFEVEFKRKELWDNGAVVQVEIRNKGTERLEGWKLECAIGGKAESVWDAEKIEEKDGIVAFGHKENNGVIEPESVVRFEYLAGFDQCVEPEAMKFYYFDYMAQAGKGETPTESPELVTSIEPAASQEPVASVESVASIEPAVSLYPDTTIVPGENEKEIDTDEDGLWDDLEEEYGTDKTKKDTDGDGLSDFAEIFLTGTNPLMIDSDENGVLDLEEDEDNDGLHHGAELEIKTNPRCPDTDSDGLTDGEERITYQTNPLLEDTDEDGIFDGDEIVLGLNPMLQDSDGNGILDSNEKIPQKMESEVEIEEKPELTKVEVALAGTGSLEKNTSIKATYGEDVLSSEVAGLVGSPVEIDTTCEFDKAEVAFSYDAMALGETKEENLGVLWYDEEHGQYVVMDSKVDVENHRVIMETTHFSTYMLVDLVLWWASITNFPVYEFIDNYDIAFVSENSEYMDDLHNGVITSARAVAYNAKLGDHICEIEYGKTACVEFDFGKEKELNFNEVNEEFDDAFWYSAECNGLEDTGEGCCISAGLDLAIEKLGSTGKRNEKIIVLYCSGEEMDDMDHSVEEAIKQGIKIYPVFFENGVYKDIIVEKTALTGGVCIDGTEYDLYEDADLGDLVGKVWDTFPKIRKRMDKRGIDSDKDGVPDIFEKQGMLACNGTMIYTDPMNADTDGDGLSDGEELNLRETEEEHYVACLESLPNLDDTDGDGLVDYEDPKPRSRYNIGRLMNMNEEKIRLYRIQNWLVKLGYLNMEGNDYGVNYGALTRTAVNVYRLNHGFNELIDLMDRNTYAMIANDYYNLIGQGEFSYERECKGFCEKRYVTSIRIIKPRLAKSYVDKGVKVVFKDNSTIREKNGREIEIYLYDYTKVVMELLKRNLGECNKVMEKKGINRFTSFAEKVDNDGPWDIKRKKQWYDQVGSIPWCSGKFPFVFNDEIINPEILGNITYGYWGTYIGFSERTLLRGGDVASVFSKFELDSEEDKKMIQKGVKLYRETKANK